MKKKELIGAVEDCAVSVKNLEEKIRLAIPSVFV